MREAYDESSMNETTMAPPVDEQRALLTERIAQYKRLGFSEFMEAIALEAQAPGTNPDQRAAHAKQVAAHHAKSRNMYAAAERLDLLLADLPEPESTA